MSTQNRPRRTQPARSRPNREFYNILNQNTGSTSSSANNAHANGENWTDTVGYGVKLGYRVIEEQIRQGQRIAQQVNSGSYGMGSMNNDVQELAQSIQRYCEDSAQLYMRLMGSMTSDMAGRATGNNDTASPWNNTVGEVMETFLGNLGKFSGVGSQPNAYQSNTQSRSAGGFNQQSGNRTESSQLYSALQLQVSSPQTVEINVNLQAVANSYEVDRLYEQDPALPPLNDVTLSMNAGTLTVAVSVADDQPAGNYNGIIYEAGSRQH